MSNDRHRGRRLELWVTEAQHAKLRELAASDDRTSTSPGLSAIIREAIDAWLETIEERRLFDRRSTSAPVDVDRRTAAPGRRAYERRNLKPHEEQRIRELFPRHYEQQLAERRGPGGRS